MKNKQNCLHRGGGILRQAGLRFSAFTLAEMMVVMLIMSIILAAMAPVMTTRSKADSSSPWRYSPNNSSDAYFGTGNAQVAMIGQPNKLEADDAAKLIINSSDTLKYHISFKLKNLTLGHLLLDENNNIILGNSDLNNNTGTRLTVLGSEALLSNTTGSNNTAVGVEALKSNSTGAENTAIGEASLMSNTSGKGNNVLGTSALRNNTTGSNNTAVGQDTLYNSNASYNTAIGWYALNADTSGAYNNALGAKSLYNLKTGEHNVAVGYESLYYSNGGGSFNTAVGNYSQLNDTSGSYNTALGYDSLRNNNGGNYNTALGYRSNYDESNTNHNVTGSIAVGAGATAFSDYATVIGYDAGSGNTNTVTIGVNSNTSATKAVAIGNSSAASGESSVALGDSSIAKGSNAIAIGKSASVAAKSGYTAFSDGIAIGKNAKIEGTSCGWGTCTYKAGIAIGQDAYTMSSDGIVVGNSATSECNSVAIGYSADALRHAVAIGHEARANDKSVAIGYQACKDVTGDYVVCIGAGSGPSYDVDKSQDHMVYLGSSSDTVYIPGNLIVGKSTLLGSRAVNDGHTYPVFLKAHNKDQWSDWVYLGTDDYKGGDDNFYRTNPITVGPFTLGPSDSFSDRRLKFVGKEFSSGLDKIKELKVYNYTFKKDKSKTPHVGVIAQDLQKVFPSAVKKGTDGFLTIRMGEMFYAMINAIKELDLKYQAQEKRINDLEKQLQKQDARLKLLESKIK